MYRGVFLLLGLLFSFGVTADDHGTFNCTDSGFGCLLDDPIDADTVNFIRALPNQSIDNWERGDTITVCYSTMCATYGLESVFGGLNGLRRLSMFENPETLASNGGPDGYNCGSSSNYSLQPVYESWYVGSNVPGDPGHYVTYIAYYQWVRTRHSLQVC